MTCFTRYLLAYHDLDTLNACEAPEGTVRMHLPSLSIPRQYAVNALCESRALLHIALNPTPFINSAHYLGLFQASYPQKFPNIPSLTKLPLPNLWGEAAPYTVYGPVVGPHYMKQSERWHPGMRKTLEAILQRAGIPISDKPTVYCSSFIAHTSTWQEFLPAWLRMFTIAQDYIGTYSPTPGGHPDLAPAYLMERLTCAWFAQARVQCLPILSEDGQAYSPAYE